MTSESKEDVFGKLLQTTETVLADNTVVPTSNFRTKKQVALYFSADWCRPCHEFTPKLAKYYTATKGAMEIVFVSLDRDRRAYDRYRSTMPWPALPFNPDVASELQELAGVTGIPTLAVFNAAGRLEIPNARSMVLQKLAEKKM